MRIFKTDFRIDTFFRRRAITKEDTFGIYLITGKQGSNKSWFATYLASLQDKKMVKYIKTNIKSMNIPDFEHQYFTKISEIVQDTEENVVYIIDEISRKYKKNSPCDDQFYAWLNQSRKRKRIVILITQEYLELPMWIRRPCRYMYTSQTILLLTPLLGWYRCVVGDGYNLVFDKDEGIYTCPTIQKIIYKRNKKIGSYYDTFEPINDL